MGGGGGGSWGTFSKNNSPSNLLEKVRKAEERAVGSSFETELNALLGSLLSKINDRDPEKVNERLGLIKTSLEESSGESFDQLFGGSVAKHTYVDGLSDIDSILTINGTGLDGKSPQFVLARLEKALQKKLGAQATISHGRMAVTLEYKDGMVIQILPAVRASNGHLRVPSSRRDDWSQINPVAFQQALTARNNECGKKLIPTIKLAKAVNGQLPEAQRLSGYHMESLAIAAFRSYQGPRTSAAMLPFYFEQASTLVLTPIKDRTGQSIHVDEYLGPANSENRQIAGHIMGRVARRMRNASTATSTAQWLSLFGLEE